MAQAERTGIFRAIEALIGCILGISANAFLVVFVALAVLVGVGPGLMLLWEVWHNGIPTTSSCTHGCSLSFCLWPGRFCLQLGPWTGGKAMLFLYGATVVAVATLVSFSYTVVAAIRKSRQDPAHGSSGTLGTSEPSCAVVTRQLLFYFLMCVCESLCVAYVDGALMILVLFVSFFLLLFLLIPWRWKEIFEALESLRNHRWIGNIVDYHPVIVFIVFLFLAFLFFAKDVAYALKWGFYYLVVFGLLDVLVVLNALVIPLAPLGAVLYATYGMCAGASDLHYHGFTTKVDTLLAVPVVASSPWILLPLRALLGVLGLATALAVFAYLLAWMGGAKEVFVGCKDRLGHESGATPIQADGSLNTAPLKPQVDMLVGSMVVPWMALWLTAKAWFRILAFFALVFAFVAPWRACAAVNSFSENYLEGFKALLKAIADYVCGFACGVLILVPLAVTAAAVDFFFLHMHWGRWMEWGALSWHVGERLGSVLLGQGVWIVGNGVGLATLAATGYMMVMLVKQVHIEFAEWDLVRWGHPLRACSAAFVEYCIILAGNVTSLGCLATPLLVTVAMSDHGLYVMAVTCAVAALCSNIRIAARLLHGRDSTALKLSKFCAVAILDGFIAWALLWPLVALWILPFRFEGLILRHSHIWLHVRTSVHTVMPHRFQWKSMGVTAATLGFMFEHGLNWVDLYVGDVVFTIVAFCLVRSLAVTGSDLAGGVCRICRGDAPWLTSLLLDDICEIGVASVAFVWGCFLAISDSFVFAAGMVVVLTIWRAPLMFQEMAQSKEHYRSVVFLQFAKLLRDFMFFPIIVLFFPGVPVLLVGLCRDHMPDSFVGAVVFSVPSVIAYACAGALTFATTLRLRRAWKTLKQRIRGWPLCSQELLQVSSVELRFTADGRGFLHLTGQKVAAFGAATRAEVHVLGRRPGQRKAGDAAHDVTLIWDDPAWDALGMNAIGRAMRMFLPFQLTNTMIDLEYLTHKAVGDAVVFDIHLGSTAHLLHRDTLLQHVKTLGKNTVAILQVQVEIGGTESLLCSLAMTMNDFRWALEHKTPVSLSEVAALSASSGVKEALQKSEGAMSGASSAASGCTDASKDLRRICAEGEANLASWQDAVWRICLRSCVAIVVDAWHLVLVFFVALVPWCAADLCRVCLLPDKFWPMRRFMSTLESFRPREDLANRIDQFHALARTARSVCAKNELALSPDSVREEKLKEAADAGKAPAAIKTYRRAVSALQPYEDYRYAVRTVLTVYLYNDLTPWTSLDAFEVLIHVLQAEYELQFATQCALHLWIAPARDEKEKRVVELATLASEQLCEQLATRSLQEMFEVILDKQKPLQDELDQAANSGCSCYHFFQKDSATLKQMIREAAITTAAELALIPAMLCLLLTGYRVKVMCKQILAAHSASWRRKIVYAQFLVFCHEVVMVLEFVASTVIIIITLTQPTDFFLSCVDVMTDNQRFRGHRLVKLLKVSRKKLSILWRWCKWAIGHLGETAVAMYEAGWSAYQNMLYTLCIAVGFPPICLELILTRVWPTTDGDNVVAGGVALLLSVVVFVFALFVVPHDGADASWFFEEEAVLLAGLFILTIVNFVAMLQDPKTHRHEGDQVSTTDIPLSPENMLAMGSAVSDAVQLWGLPFTLVAGMAGRVKDVLPGSSDAHAETEAEPAWWRERVDAWRETAMGALIDAAPAVNFRADFGATFFYVSIWGSVAMVVMWLLVASIPYSLEKSLKAFPPGTFAHRRWWTLLSKTLSSTAFMPIVNNLLKSFDCVTLQHGTHVLEDMPDISCWAGHEGFHWTSQITMTHASLLALGAYIATCTALAQEFVNNSSQTLRITSSPLYESSTRLKGLLVAFILHLNSPSADATVTTVLLCLCLFLGIVLSVWTAKYESVVLRAGGAKHAPCSVPELTAMRVGGFAGFAWSSLAALGVLYTPQSSTWAAWLFVAGSVSIIAVTLIAIALRRRRIAAENRVWAAGVLKRFAAKLQGALKDKPALPAAEGDVMPEGDSMCSFDDLHKASEAGSVRNFTSALLGLEERLEAKALPKDFLRHLGRWRALLHSLQAAGNILEEVSEKDVEGGSHQDDQTVIVMLDNTDFAALSSALPATGIEDHDDSDPALVFDEVFLPERSHADGSLIRPNTVIRRGLLLVDPEVPPHGSFREVWHKLASSPRDSPGHRLFVFRRRWSVLEHCVDDLCTAAAIGFKPGDANDFASFLHERVTSSSKELLSVTDALYTCLAAAGPTSLAEMEQQSKDEDAAPTLLQRATPGLVAQELLARVRGPQDEPSKPKPLAHQEIWATQLQAARQQQEQKEREEAEDMKKVFASLSLRQGSLRKKKASFPYMWGNNDCSLITCKFTAGRKTRVNFFAVPGCVAVADPSRGQKYFLVTVPGEKSMSFSAADAGAAFEWVKELNAHIAAAEQYRMLPEAVQLLVDTEFPTLLQDQLSSSLEGNSNRVPLVAAGSG